MTYRWFSQLIGILAFGFATAAHAQAPEAWKFFSASGLSGLPPYIGEKRGGPEAPNKSLLVLSLGEKALKLNTYYVEKQPGDEPKPAAASAPNPGAVRMLATSSLIERWLNAEAELAYSSPAALCGVGEENHGLWRMSLKGASNHLSYGAEFRRVGKDFINVAGTGYGADQQGIELWSEEKLGVFAFKTSLARFTDNTAADPGRPVTARTIGGTSLRIALPAWPTLNLFYSGGFTATAQEPEGFAPQRGTLRSAGAQLTYGRSGWEATAATGLSFNDLENRGSAAVRTQTPRFSLGVKYQPGNLPLQANTVASYTETKTSDGNTDNDAFNLSGSLSWDLGATRIGKSQLLAGGGFTRRVDAVDPAASHNEGSVWMRFKVTAY